MAIVRLRRSPLPPFIVVEMISSIWCEKNAWRYRDKRSQLPIRQILAAAGVHAIPKKRRLIEYEMNIVLAVSTLLSLPSACAND